MIVLGVTNFILFGYEDHSIRTSSWLVLGIWPRLMTGELIETKVNLLLPC